jgi:hypothetical protein
METENDIHARVDWLISEGLSRARVADMLTADRAYLAAHAPRKEPYLTEHNDRLATIDVAIKRLQR